VLRRLSRLERRHHLVRSAGRTYVFDHHQIQDALYQGLAPLLREQYHGLIADALGRGAAPLAGRAAWAYCYHSFRAGRPGDALAVLDPALAHCDAVNANEAAVELARDALAPETGLAGRARGDLLLRSRTWLDRLGRRAEERRALDEAVALAGKLGDDELLCRAKQDLGVHLERTTRYAESREALEGAVELARQLGRVDLEHAARRHLGILLLYRGRYERALEDPAAAREHFERALALRRSIDDQSGAAESLVALGRLALAEGDGRGASAVLDEAIELGRTDVRPGLLVLASAHRARASGGAPDEAAALRAKYAGRLRLRERIEADFALHDATGDAAHLDRAYEGLEVARARAPERNRASLVERLPLHRAIVQARNESV